MECIFGPPGAANSCFSVATCGSLIAASMQARSDGDRTALAVAAVTLLCAVVWAAVNIGWNYGDHISGLFYTGSRSALPAQISSHTYRVKDSIGFDGQFYHLIAHDPLIRRGFAPFVDNPPLRWRRISQGSQRFWRPETTVRWIRSTSRSNWCSFSSVPSGSRNTRRAF